MPQAIFIGINGNVICLDRTNGQQLWLAELVGSDFVNVLVDGNQVIATTKGEVFCLDAATGNLIWHNGLRGQGLGLAAIASPTASASSVPPAEKKRQEAAAAGAAAGAAAAR